MRSAALRRWRERRGATDAATADRLTLPSAAIYVRWGFPEPVARREWDLSIRADPGSSVGVYLALENGTIDGSAYYLGLQSDVANPAIGRGVGKGLIFSTWSSFDAADTRIADDGFRELGTHEGRFVGVRRPYPWGAGDYRVALTRAPHGEAEPEDADWFDLSIQPLGPPPGGGRRPESAGDAEWIGAIRFRRRDRARPAAIDPGGVLFLEVYSGASHWSEVPTWEVSVMAYGDGARCPSGRLEYPRPYGREVKGASVTYDEAGERVELRLGAGAPPRAPERAWP